MIDVKKLIDKVVAGKSVDFLEAKSDLAPFEHRQGLSNIRSNMANFHLQVSKAWKEFKSSIDEEYLPYIDKEIKRFEFALTASNSDWYQRAEAISNKLLKLINPDY
jgi:hypothetical protein